MVVTHTAAEGTDHVKFPVHADDFTAPPLEPLDWILSQKSGQNLEWNMQIEEDVFLQTHTHSTYTVCTL